MKNKGLGAFLNPLIALIPLLRNIIYPLKVTIRKKVHNGEVVLEDRAKETTVSIGKKKNKKKQVMHQLMLKNKIIPRIPDECISIQSASPPLNLMGGKYCELYECDGCFVPIRLGADKADKQFKSLDLIDNNQRGQYISNYSRIGDELNEKEKPNYVLQFAPYILIIMTALAMIWIITNFQQDVKSMQRDWWNMAQDFLKEFEKTAGEATEEVSPKI